MIGDQGPFDPTGFIEGDPGTYPVPIDADPYAAGQHWTLTAPAVIGGDDLVAGDLLYVVSFGRGYGAHTYGDAYLGWLESGPWAPVEVSFRGWAVDLPAWDRPAPPYTGCPLGDTMPGYRIVIEAQYLPESLEVRRYGQSTYGGDLYGDDIDLDVATMPWNDITETGFGVNITVGNTDGNPYVTVSEARLDFIDETAVLFAMAQPDTWFGPRVGTIIRVGISAPSLEYTPLFVGRIERVTDVHDAPPRLVEVDAFGFTFDTVQTLPNWSRPAEPVDVRLTATAAASGYVWGPAHPFPATPGPSLLALPVEDVVARDALDNAAVSARWYLSAAADGRLRTRPWPETGAGSPVLRVSDCVHDDAGTGNRVMFGAVNYLEDGDQVVFGYDDAATVDELMSPEVALVGDMAELLNLAVLDNIVDTGRDVVSAHFDQRRHLIFDMSDGTTIDAGRIQGGPP